MEDLSSILPFANTADLIEIKGKYLLEAFENGVSGIEEKVGGFPQVTGKVLIFLKIVRGVARVSQRQEMKGLLVKNEWNLTSLLVISTSP